jgi:integrase
VKKLREGTERVRSLSTAEESKLLGRLNVWAGRVTRVALLTGMRRRRAAGTAKDLLDLQHGTLTLTDTKNREPRVVFLNDRRRHRPRRHRCLPV